MKLRAWEGEGYLWRSRKRVSELPRAAQGVKDSIAPLRDLGVAIKLYVRVANLELDLLPPETRSRYLIEAVKEQ